MRRTTPADLAVPFVVVALAFYIGINAFYGSLPALRWFAPLPLFALAGAEFVAARRVRSAVGHVPGAKPMEAILIARCVALGKASSLVASGVAGAAVGLILQLIPDAGRVRAAAVDLRVGVAMLIAGVLLTASGLLLERAGIDPSHED